MRRCRTPEDCHLTRFDWLDLHSKHSCHTVSTCIRRLEKMPIAKKSRTSTSNYTHIELFESIHHDGNKTVDQIHPLLAAPRGLRGSAV
jgi:hypothetical protein